MERVWIGFIRVGDTGFDEGTTEIVVIISELHSRVFALRQAQSVICFPAVRERRGRVIDGYFPCLENLSGGGQVGSECQRELGFLEFLVILNRVKDPAQCRWEAFGRVLAMLA